MNMKKVLLSFCLIVGGLHQGAAAFTQSNFFRPYDAALRLDDWKKSKWSVGLQGEYGSKSSGRNWDDKRRSILALHDDTQSTIAMVKGSNNQDLTALKKKIDNFIGMPALDEDATGLLKDIGKLQLTGDFKEWDLTFWAGYKLPINILPGTFTLRAYLPVIRKEVHDVKIQDLTKNDTAVGRVNEVGNFIKENMTNDIKENVKRWGNLDLYDWNKTGLGDVALMLTWDYKLRQEKEYLKNVGVHGKVGLSLPTSEEKDEDKAFSMPMGFDGVWAIPFGLALELDFVYKIRAGIDADFVVMLDKERSRRMKTSKDQTEFLLLNKGQATKEYGLTWQFHLYLQAVDFIGGLSAKVAYQFVKHDQDRLVPKNNDFDYTIVNSARSLEEWNIHNFIFSLNYDAFKDKPTWKVAPQISLFFKLPVAGKNVIDAQTFGGQLAFRF